MKKIGILISLMLCMFLVTGAFAGGQQQTGQTGMQTSQAGMQQAQRANNLMGKEVQSQGGERLGTVEDLVIDQQGQVAFVVLSSADDNKMRPILFKSLSGDPQQDQLTANIDKERFQNAPSFEKGEWQQALSPQWESNVYGYYGEEAPSPGMMQQPHQREMQTPGATGTMEERREGGAGATERETMERRQ